MNENELRIGNLLHIPLKTKNRLITVTGINKEDDKAYVDYDENGLMFYDDISRFQPVPLTEEWLIKFGFETRKDKGMSPTNSWQGMDHWVKEQIIFRGMPKFGLSLYGISAYPKRDIKYVHQLQNLYFAITGTELTIQP